MPVTDASSCTPAASPARNAENPPGRRLRFQWGPASLLFAALGCSTGSMAATTTTVVDIPAATGGTQRFLYVRPDAPVAFIVQFPGGDGVLGIQNDGSMPTRVGQCNPIGRNRAAIADRGVGLALIDATSQGSVGEFPNLLEVVRYVRERHDVPIWVAGGSASTDAGVQAAALLPADIPAGLILSAPGAPSALLPTVTRPAAAIWHALDPDQSGNATYQALTSARVRERATIQGGSPSNCGYHLFQGADTAYVNAVIGVIERNKDVTTSPPLNIEAVSGTWFNPSTTGQGFVIEVVPSLNAMMVAWFTWGDMPGDHLWFTGLGPLSSNGAEVQLIRSAGGRFNDPTPVADQVVGQATLRFTDCTRGVVTFRRTDTDRAGTFPIARLTPAPAGCVSAAQ